MTRRERLECKLAKRQDWAAKAGQRSVQRFDAAGLLADQIPLGQPILLGHHSEAHARRDAERISSNMSKGVAEAKLASHHAGKAAGLAHQLDRTIFSDDENAIEALEARIAENEEEAEKYAAINKAWRKSKGNVDALVASEMVGPKLAATITETMRLCPWLDKPLDTTNLRASIRRDRERIEQIRKQQARTERAETNGGVTIEGSEEYVRVTFAEKPARATIDALRTGSFHWSDGSWWGRRAALPPDVQRKAKE